MQIAIYQGSVVEIENIHETFITIKADYGSLIIDKEKLHLIPEGIVDDLIKELSTIKVEIFNVMNRIYHLESEYHKKMEALREMYLDSRSKEISLVNRIIRNSQEHCQK